MTDTTRRGIIVGESFKIAVNNEHAHDDKHDTRGAGEPKTVADATTSHSFSLFTYVTTLVSGLVLLALLALSGYALSAHWLGDSAQVGVLGEWAYRSQLFLAIALVLFGALHAVMHMRTVQAHTDEQSLAARWFRAVFLTILTIVVLVNVTTLVYIAADMLMGTGNYSGKSLGRACLDAIQVAVLASLLWWYFKRPRAGTARQYSLIVGIITLVTAALLIMFPVMSQRGAVIDARTSDDLAAIGVKINEYAQKNTKLPANLHDLELADNVAGRIGAYSYEIKKTETPQPDVGTPERPASPAQDSGGSDGSISMPSGASVLAYKLCAMFKTDTTKVDNGFAPIVPLMKESSQWSRHSAGRHCFDQMVYSDGAPETAPRPLDTMFLNSLNTRP